MRRDVSTFESHKIGKILEGFGAKRAGRNFGTWYVPLSPTQGFFIPHDKTTSFRVLVDHMNDSEAKFTGVAWLKFTVLYLKFWKNAPLEDKF